MDRETVFHMVNLNIFYTYINEKLTKMHKNSILLQVAINAIRARLSYINQLT